MNEQDSDSREAEMFRKRFYVYGALAGVSTFVWGSSHLALQNYMFHSTSMRKMGVSVNVCGLFNDVSIMNHLQMSFFLNGRYLLFEGKQRRKNFLKYLFSTGILTLVEYPLEGILHRILLSKHRETNGKIFDLKGYCFKLASHFIYDGVSFFTRWLGCKLLGIEDESKKTKIHNRIMSVFGYEEKNGKVILKTDQQLSEEAEESKKSFLGINENLLYGMICALATTLGTVTSHPFRVLTIRTQCDRNNNRYLEGLSDGIFAGFVGSSVSRIFFMMGVIPVMFINICLNSMAEAARMRVGRFTRDISQLASSEYEKKDVKEGEKKIAENTDNEDQPETDNL